MSSCRPSLIFVLLTAAACSGTPAERSAAPVEAEPAAEKPAAEAAHAEAHAEEGGGGADIELTPSVPGARVFFVSPDEGAEVSSPVELKFGIEKMTVAKAGVMEEGSGHHHLIVDAELPAMNEPIPANEHYIHYGDGSTSTELELEPGEHKLRLLLGDHRHIPHDPPVTSEVLTITVK